MRMEFKILIRGEESLRSKFKETLTNNPNLHLDLMRAFGNSIMMALRLNEGDNITIDGFRAGEVAVPETALNDQKHVQYEMFANESNKKVD